MTGNNIASTPQPPYYAVIFTSARTQVAEGYDQTAERMVELAQGMPGFLGVESARGADGLGITVSYWRDAAAIAAARTRRTSRRARDGKKLWYDDYFLRIAKVERAYRKTRTTGAS